MLKAWMARILPSSLRRAEHVAEWGELTLPSGRKGEQALQVALARQLDVTYVMDVKSEVADFQVGPGRAGAEAGF